MRLATFRIAGGREARAAALDRAHEAVKHSIGKAPPQAWYGVVR